MKLPPLNIFNTLYSVCQAWEWRRWSSKTTFRRLLYEAILNYQALIETHGDKKSILRRISIAVSNRVKNKRVKSSGIDRDLGVLESFPERKLLE